MSLRRRLLAALLGAVALAGLAASGATYYAARKEVQTLLDQELREVALSIRQHALLDLGRLGALQPEGARRVVVQVWDPRGFVVYLSNSQTPLPFASEPGYSTVKHEGRRWRVFTAHGGAQVIQAAQAIDERSALATGAALRVLVPVLGALPLLALLIWLILERGFSPFSRIADAVRARSPAALEPLAGDRIPEEVAPLVEALNSLLDRLQKAFDMQRRFAADAAHELRTPLTALRLQVQLLEAARTDAERAAGISGLKERAARAERLVQQLLALARLEPETAQRAARPVALDVLVRGLVEEFAPLASQNGVALEMGPLEPAWIAGHGEALGLLVSNLLDNAIRYGGSGTRVHLAVREKGGTAILEVCDEGPGIPPEERDRIFDRFYRGREAAAGGSGLGLSIVRQVAALHSGSVELVARPGGKGSCARFIAPVLRAPSPGSVPRAGIERPEPFEP